MSEAYLNSPKVTLAPWRRQAAQIVEELFPATPADAWDALLDLRQHLLHGSNWNRTLDLFLACREQLEAEHYLPFYRLRQLLSGSLELEAAGQSHSPAPLRQILSSKHRSLADIKRAIRREWFEHDLTAPIDQPVDLRVVER
jgi:hypothetical protein